MEDRLVLYTDDQGLVRWDRINPDGNVVATSHSGFANRTVCEDEMFRVNAKPYIVVVDGKQGSTVDLSGHVCSPGRSDEDYCCVCGRDFEVEEMDRVAQQLKQIDEFNDDVTAQIQVSQRLSQVVTSTMKLVAAEYSNLADGAPSDSYEEEVFYAARNLTRAIEATAVKPAGWDV